MSELEFFRTSMRYANDFETNALTDKKIFMEKAIIYLINLSHIHNDIFATDTIPLNIGYLAAYAKKIFADEIEIRLFNIHAELNDAMKKQKPHILGGSNYIWNSNLSYHSLAYYKKQYPDMITVMGGPSFSYKREGRQNFFLKRDLLDFYIEGEGELAFNAFLASCLRNRMNIERIKEEELPGCNYMRSSGLVSHPPPNRIKRLDDIPSPYLNGLFDAFLERGLTPILQTNRGCPFSCAYCCSSIEYYNKVNFFTKERVEEEIGYIARKVKSPSIHIHDDNFGMFEQDYEICQKFKDVQKRYGWPTFISAATGKNVKERIAKCIELLGSSIVFSLSVQSTNESVLKNVNRKNINLNDFWNLQKRFKARGDIKTHCELILPLPGETPTSYLEAVRTVISLKVDSIGPYTTMLLPGSPLNDEERFDKFRMTKKYRVIPWGFGKYDGTNIIEIEKVAVATKDLSFDDYIVLRSFNFIIYCFYNNDTFKELICYLESVDISAYDFCYNLFSSIDAVPLRVKRLFKDFTSDAKKELWDSEEEINKYYSKKANFNKLLTHETGCNLLQKYHGLLYTDYFRGFLEFGINVGVSLLNAANIDYDKEIFSSLFHYVFSTRGAIFDIAEEDLIVDLAYDLHSWKEEGFKRPLAEYKRATRLKFLQTERQKEIMLKYIRIYGNTADGKGRILTRINPEELFRKVSRVDSAKSFVSVA